MNIKDMVLLEECWEDESGNYHDEYAEIISVEPLRLKFIDVSDIVADFLSQQEFTIEDITI